MLRHKRGRTRRDENDGPFEPLGLVDRRQEDGLSRWRRYEHESYARGQQRSARTDLSPSSAASVTSLMSAVCWRNRWSGVRSASGMASSSASPRARASCSLARTASRLRSVDAAKVCCGRAMERVSFQERLLQGNG